MSFKIKSIVASEVIDRSHPVYPSLEPQDGKTKIKFRFNVKTNNLLFILASPSINIGKIHSDVMQKGFKALNRFLQQK